MEKNNFKILFAGEGGQGVQVIAEILAKAAFAEGKQAAYIPNFGVEQRGGVSLAFVVISDQVISYPKFRTADVLAILSDRCLKRVEGYLGPKTKKILGPAAKGGLKTKHPPKVWNVVVLGKVNREGKIVKEESLIKAMNDRFAKRFKKDSSLEELDLKALKGE